VQLTVRDVSKILDVTEAMVTRWIKQRGLPARYAAGQYRFHKAELLEWATVNNVKVNLEFFNQLATEDEAGPSLANAVEAGGIHYHLQDTSKDRALRALVEILPLPDDLDRELLLHLFLAREASASTAIGDGIAIPHVRNPIVLQVPMPAVTLAFLSQPVDFGAPDGKPVHVLFSIISPTAGSHLQLLSRLSYTLHDRRLKDTIVRQAPREEILREIRRVEPGMAAPAVGKAAT
jgi:nitrogen PTS system EIIA component